MNEPRYCMKKLFLILVFFTSISCFKEVAIDIPRHEPLPVVNSIFFSDSKIALTLGKTQPILENGNVTIENGLIKLYEDEMLKDTMYLVGSSFSSSIIAKAGKSYKVEIETPDFSTLYSKDRLPNYPRLSFLNYKDSVYIGEEGDLFSQASITIDDEPDYDNFYELIMFMKAETEDDIYNSNIGYLLYDSVNNDIVFQNEGLLNYYPYNLLFSDELFDGKKQTLRINFTMSNTGFIGAHKNDVVNLIMHLRHVSKNYYEYNKTLTLHYENQFGDIWDGVGEPVPMFTNIENGYGIFAGYSEVTDTIYKER
ncbi:hypothetical protein MNBD_BACTEROID03-1288 [hydrothermal vent metagenome]|uniref:DUF4249 domain-containing protein n=1 Tax=hydrothermal vent metagenome TaxID=652676 RepID=A0A3B0TRT1_9ZZZZ